MSETVAPAPSPAHELLLALAGWVDDDLLATGRELVAVGEDVPAVELLVASLAAGRTVLPEPVRAALVEEADARRVQPDAERALAPGAASAGPTHRFAPDAGPTEIGQRIAAITGSLPVVDRTGARVALTWRLTPAGAAPGPLPHPVLLVELDDPGPVEVLAYQLGASLARAGVPASVEAFTDGPTLPPYQREALAASRPLLGDASGDETSAGGPRASAEHPSGPHVPTPTPRTSGQVPTTHVHGSTPTPHPRSSDDAEAPGTSVGPVAPSDGVPTTGAHSTRDDDAPPVGVSERADVPALADLPVRETLATRGNTPTAGDVPSAGDTAPGGGEVGGRRDASGLDDLAAATGDGAALDKTTGPGSGSEPATAGPTPPGPTPSGPTPSGPDVWDAGAVDAARSSIARSGTAHSEAISERPDAERIDPGRFDSSSTDAAPNDPARIGMTPADLPSPQPMSGGAVGFGATTDDPPSNASSSNGLSRHELLPNDPPSAGRSPDDAAPFEASPFEASPFGAGPFEASPFAASPFEASPFDTAPVEPAPSGRAPNGPTFDGPASNGPASNGPASNGPASNGPASNGPASNGPALNGPALNGPALNGPALNGIAPHDPGLHRSGAGPTPPEGPATTGLPPLGAVPGPGGPSRTSGVGSPHTVSGGSGTGPAGSDNRLPRRGAPGPDHLRPNGMQPHPTVGPSGSPSGPVPGAGPFDDGVGFDQEPHPAAPDVPGPHTDGRDLRSGDGPPTPWPGAGSGADAGTEHPAPRPAPRRISPVPNDPEWFSTRGQEPSTAPTPTPTPTDGADALDGPLLDTTDRVEPAGPPLGHRNGHDTPPPGAEAWDRDWSTGDWSVSGSGANGEQSTGPQRAVPGTRELDGPSEPPHPGPISEPSILSAPQLPRPEDGQGPRDAAAQAGGPDQPTGGRDVPEGSSRPRHRLDTPGSAEPVPPPEPDRRTPPRAGREQGRKDPGRRPSRPSSSGNDLGGRLSPNEQDMLRRLQEELSDRENGASEPGPPPNGSSPPHPDHDPSGGGQPG